MKEIIQQLQDKAGLTKEQAEKSLQVLKEYIEGQLPPMMRGMVEKFLKKHKDDDDDVVGL